MIDLDSLPEHVRPTAIRLAQDITFHRAIDKGGNGIVLVGKNNILKKDIAVKFYYWGGGDHPEPAMLAELESPHTLQVLHAEKIDDENAFFTTPFCDLGDLDDALEERGFGPLEGLDVILQVAAGVSYLHGKGFLHRDLKLSNIFCLNQDRFVIGDFGSVASQDKNGYAKTLTRHSLLYRPPEEINSKAMCKQSDVYQIGLAFYQLLGGHLPYNEYDWLSKKQKATYSSLDASKRQFYATDIIETLIMKGNLIDLNSLPPWVPLSLKSAIRKCCNKDIGKRFESVADFSAKMNNIRKSIPDWRIDDYPTLHRKGKRIRVVSRPDMIFIEKNVGRSWRAQRRFEPKSIIEAVKIAESL